MTVLLHLGHHGAGRHHRAAQHWFTAAPVPVDVPGTGERRPVDGRVFAVHRLGATIVGLALLAFGVLGLTSGVPFLTTHGQRFLGLSSNGLLSTVSVVVAGLLLGAAARGPRAASTAMLVLGALFLVSALGNLAVLGTGLELPAFQLGSVVFSVVVGLLLLLLGAYGRITGNLPDDSPYAHPRARAPEPPDQASTPEEIAAEAAMREAEIAVVEHRATEDQRRRVAAMAGLRTREDRRRCWMAFDLLGGPRIAAWTSPAPGSIGSRTSSATRADGAA